MKKFKTFLIWILGLFTFIWRLTRRHAVNGDTDKVETFIKEEERDKYERDKRNEKR